MTALNYKIKRNLLFEYISSIEIDLREYLKTNYITVENFKEKIINRIESDFPGKSSQLYEMQKYNFLDFGDYTQILSLFFKERQALNKEIKELIKELEIITPIRNRVMHSRPLLSDDDTKIISFTKKYKLFDNIISFDHLADSLEKVENNPNYFYDKTPDFNCVYIQKAIEHNLPMVDYDDTGFVGREEVKNKIVKKLKSAYPTISIIGDGGIGKTSTVLSCIYDIIDSEDFGFEKVIWVTLKTKALLDGEFKDIKNSFKSFTECIEKNEILKKEGTTTIDMLLFYMSVFKTLLILDNLETINSEDIRNLFEDLPMGSKIIITSRIGIREYESRLVLPKFTETEALYYFRKLVNVYDVNVLRKKKDEEINKYLSKLYYSPLCIKWFVINVGKGNNPDIIVNSQEELVEFCLSNVFDKLSDMAKYIIQILLVKQTSCSIAELVYINNANYTFSIEAINELCACNFLEQTEYGVYNIPDFAKKYLKHKLDNIEQINEIKEKNNKLVGMLENLSRDIHLTEKNHPLSFFPSNNNEKIATIYMLKCIECSKRNNFDEMDQFYDAATKAAPKFADIYKAAAYLYGKNSQDTKAIDNYNLALEYSKNENDAAYVKSFYALYLTNFKFNYEEAERYIVEAMQQIPDNPNFIANYARVLKCQKRFEEAATQIFELLNSELFVTEYLKRNLYSEYVDIKARHIEYIENDSEKCKVLNELIKYIEKIRYDYFSVGLYKAFARILKNMIFINMRKSISKQINLFVDKYFSYILFVNFRNPDFEITVEQLNKILLNKIDLLNYTCQFSKEEVGFIDSINKEKGYGFIRIRKWETKLFFHVTQVNFEFSEKIIGEKVSFIPYYKNEKWSALSISIVNNNDFDE